MDVLPKYMANMRQAMESPVAMSLFSAERRQFTQLKRDFAHPQDFSGCYVLIENRIPKYVGISRKVFRRLKQHVTGESHNDASLAYLIASKELTHGTTRDKAMEMSDFREVFGSAKDRLRAMSCAFVEIQNPLELYLFEAFCAMELDTSDWNTFETH